MIVLDGETSQWNRSPWVSAAIGPAEESPAAMRSIASRCGRTASGSASGSSALSRAPSSAVLAARYRRGRQSTITPAFSRSPRSMRGTTRTIAYWNGLRDGTERLCEERAWRSKAGGEVLAIRPALVVRAADRGVWQPVVRNVVDDPADDITVEATGEPPVGLDEGAGPRPEHVVVQAVERPASVRARIAPRVVDVDRSAVVDQPQSTVPGQDVRVLRRAVRVRDERVEPGDVRAQLRRRSRSRRG